MERPSTTADGSAGWTLPVWAWLFGMLVLFTWQGCLTLALFGDDAWHNLTSNQPIVSGAHGQHLYLGNVGARAIVTQRRNVVYDHRYNAGYPKTPIFDGSRLAELLLVLGGGSYQPAAYKIGFAILCLLVPGFLVLTCKTLNLGNATSLLAAFLGQLVWWGPHGRTAIVTGDCELYLASLAALAHLGMLIAYHRTSSMWSWIGLLVTGVIGWFLQPLLFPIALPVLLTYYLTVGVKHDFLTWHVAFWSVELLAVLVNFPWLTDWFYSWWLRTTLPSAGLLEHRTIATLWSAPLWGGATNRILAVALIVSAAVGNTILNQTRERPAARLLAVSGGGALVLALLGIAWEPLGVVGTATLFAPALWFACIPAAHAGVWIADQLWQRDTPGRVVLAILLLVGAAPVVYWHDMSINLLARCRPGAPLEIGLGPKREAIVRTLIDYTKPDARILWEDRATTRQASRWAALLPILTDRCYIGGLDPDGFIEHSSICLIQQSLENQPIGKWTDPQLMHYCGRYNIRWIVAWSPAVIERFESWKDAKKLRPLHDDDAVGWLFEVDRVANFALKGQAVFAGADGRCIRLTNVVPENGEVVISLHYQSGMRALPGRVQIERAASGDDPIDFIRLRLSEPAVGVTLVW